MDNVEAGTTIIGEGRESTRGHESSGLMKHNNRPTQKEDRYAYT